MPRRRDRRKHGTFFELGRFRSFATLLRCRIIVCDRVMQCIKSARLYVRLQLGVAMRSVLAIDCKLLTVVEPELAVLFPSFGAGVVMQSSSPSLFAVDEILSTASSYLRLAH